MCLFFCLLVFVLCCEGKCGLWPNDPKLSDSPARRGPCAGEGGEGKAGAGSTGHDAQASSLQLMVRPLGTDVELRLLKLERRARALYLLNHDARELVTDEGERARRLELGRDIDATTGAVLLKSCWKGAL